MAKISLKNPRFSVAVRRKIFIYIVLGIGVFISLIPFIWMISTSLKSLGEALGANFFPSELTF
jgi:ABC-type glycerol-3-phosphate transport system permease component